MKFAVVMPWPGMKNAEYEFIEKLKRATETIGHELVVISNDGKIVENNRYLTKKIIKPSDIEFVLSLHYTTPKMVDSFYYYALWNPPLYMLSSPDMQSYYNNTVMIDDFIGYESVGILDHTSTIVANTNHTLDYQLFTTSVPESLIMEPKLSNKSTIFYCGINWERINNKHGRHSELFEKLDATGKIKIFGPKEFGGVKPWEGYDSYSGEIDFDGHSVIEEINKCGVSLVISSNEHRKAGAASARIYESIAAGAVVISDNNSFVKNTFGDNVLYFDYDKTSATYNFKKIMEKYDWIMSNPQVALKKVRNAQAILRSQHTLEKMIQDIIDNHLERKELHKKKFYSTKPEEEIKTFILWDKMDLNDLPETIENCITQEGVKNNVTLVLDKSFEKKLKLKIPSILLNSVTVLYTDFFAKNFKGEILSERQNTTGEIIAFCLDSIEGQDKYIAFMQPEVKWYRDHLATLKRKFDENDNLNSAYSGLAFSKHSDSNGEIRNTAHFRKFSYKDIGFYNLDFILPQLLTKAEFLIKNKNFFKLLDNWEHYIISIDGIINNNSAFSNRMTCMQNRDEFEKKFRSANLLVPFDSQVRIIKDRFKDENMFFSSSNETQLKPLNRENLMSLLQEMLRKRKKSRYIAKWFFGRGAFKV